MNLNDKLAAALKGDRLSPVQHALLMLSLSSKLRLKESADITVSEIQGLIEIARTSCAGEIRRSALSQESERDKPVSVPL